MLLDPTLDVGHLREYHVSALSSNGESRGFHGPESTFGGMQERCSRIEAGQVVFEDLDDAPLLGQHGPPQQGPTKLLARDFLEGRPACSGLHVVLGREHVPVQVARVDFSRGHGDLAPLVRAHRLSGDCDVPDGSPRADDYGACGEEPCRRVGQALRRNAPRTSMHQLTLVECQVLRSDPRDISIPVARHARPRRASRHDVADLSKGCGSPTSGQAVHTKLTHGRRRGSFPCAPPSRRWPPGSRWHQRR